MVSIFSINIYTFLNFSFFFFFKRRKKKKWNCLQSCDPINTAPRPSFGLRPTSWEPEVLLRLQLCFTCLRWNRAQTKCLSVRIHFVLRSHHTPCWQEEQALTCFVKPLPPPLPAPGRQEPSTNHFDKALSWAGAVICGGRRRFPSSFLWMDESPPMGNPGHLLISPPFREKAWIHSRSTAHFNSSSSETSWSLGVSY